MTHLPEEIAGLPASWLTYANSAYLLWFVLARIWKNWRAGGGFYGIKTAILWGDKTPAAKVADDAHREEKIRSKTTAPFTPTNSV